MHKINTLGEKNEKKLLDFPNVRMYLAAILLFSQSTIGQSDAMAHQTIAKEVTISTEGNNEANEANEAEGIYEAIFKDGLRKTLHTLTDIQQIPAGGKSIEYYRNEGTNKGKKIRPESVKAMGLPEKIDISPKKITGSVASMNLHLGSRTFNIEPWVGNIDAVILNKNALIIKTTLKDISYDKDEKLPKLLLKLWNTPVEKGKKSGFKGSTVTEI